MQSRRSSIWSWFAQLLLVYLPVWTSFFRFWFNCLFTLQPSLRTFLVPYVVLRSQFCIASWSLHVRVQGVLHSVFCNHLLLRIRDVQFEPTVQFTSQITDENIEFTVRPTTTVGSQVGANQEIDGACSEGAVWAWLALSLVGKVFQYWCNLLHNYVQRSCGHRLCICTSAIEAPSFDSPVTSKHFCLMSNALEPIWCITNSWACKL